MADKTKYCIRIHNTLVPVTQEIYQAYYGGKRQEKTLIEKDERNGVVSYDAMDTAGIVGEDMIPDPTNFSVEDYVVASIMREKLHRCLALLSEKERTLMEALYFEGLSERQLSERTNTPQRTVHDRKVKTLHKLKKMMDK